MKYFLSLNLDWIAKINDRSSCQFLHLSPLSLISLPPPLFKLVRIRCMPLGLSSKDSPCISNAPCLFETFMVRIWPNDFLLHTIHEGRNPNSSSQTLEISMPTYQFMKRMPKKNQCLLPLNVRGCPFIKIWSNGSIRTIFTEFYIVGLPHIWGSRTCNRKS